MTKKNLAEALQFYIDNDLNEVISEKSQNYFQHFQQKTAVKKVAEEKKSPIVNTFIKPQFSTDQALSILAKKLVTSEKFQSLNEIVAKAKSLAQAAKTIDELRKAVENIDGCNLKKMATNTVFADGNPNSKIMVIGEAPGNHEDLQGIPFCDDSGQMLNDMLGAINLTRQ